MNGAVVLCLFVFSIASVLTRPLDIGSLKDYMDEDIVKHLESLTPNDMRELSEMQSQGSSVGEFKGKQPSRELLEKLEHFRQLMQQKLNALGEEARTFMTKAIVSFQKEQQKNNITSILLRGKHLMEEFKNLSSKAQAELAEAFTSSRQMKFSSDLEKLNVPLTEEEQKILAGISKSKSEEEQMEEIKTKSPELYQKIAAFNDSLYTKIENMSEEPRVFMIEHIKLVEDAKDTGDPEAYKSALAQVISDAKDLSEKAQIEIASLFAPRSNEEEMLNVALKRLYTSDDGDGSDSKKKD